MRMDKRGKGGNCKIACGSKVALRAAVVYVAAEAATHKEREQRDPVVALETTRAARAVGKAEKAGRGAEERKATHAWRRARSVGTLKFAASMGGSRSRWRRNWDSRAHSPPRSEPLHASALRVSVSSTSWSLPASWTSSVSSSLFSLPSFFSFSRIGPRGRPRTYRQIRGQMSSGQGRESFTAECGGCEGAPRPLRRSRVEMALNKSTAVEKFNGWRRAEKNARSRGELQRCLGQQGSASRARLLCRGWSRDPQNKRWRGGVVRRFYVAKPRPTKKEEAAAC